MKTKQILAMVAVMALAFAASAQPVPPATVTTNYYSAQNPDLPPLPFPLVQGLKIYPLDDTSAVVDDRWFNYPTLVVEVKKKEIVHKPNFRFDTNLIASHPEWRDMMRKTILGLNPTNRVTKLSEKHKLEKEQAEQMLRALDAIKEVIPNADTKLK